MQVRYFTHNEEDKSFFEKLKPLVISMWDCRSVFIPTSVPHLASKPQMTGCPNFVPEKENRARDI